MLSARCPPIPNPNKIVTIPIHVTGIILPGFFPYTTAPHTLPDKLIINATNRKSIFPSPNIIQNKSTHTD